MKNNLLYTAEIKGKNVKFDIKLNLVSFKDGKGYVIYSPETEVYGYGYTLKEAKESFNIGLTEFLRYTTAKGTFRKEMKRLGWDIKKRKNKIMFKVPVFSDFLKKDNDLTEIINTRDYRKFTEKIPVSLAI